MNYPSTDEGRFQGFYDRLRGYEFLVSDVEQDSYADGYRQGWDQAADHPTGGHVLEFYDYV